MKMTLSRHAVALSEKEFALLETVHKLGPSNSERVQRALGDEDLIETMRLLHDLTARGLLVRPEIDEQLLYEVKPTYAELRSRVIVMASV